MLTEQKIVMDKDQAVKSESSGVKRLLPTPVQALKWAIFTIAAICLGVILLTIFWRYLPSKFKLWWCAGSMLVLVLIWIYDKKLPKSALAALIPVVVIHLGYIWYLVMGAIPQKPWLWLTVDLLLTIYVVMKTARLSPESGIRDYIFTGLGAGFLVPFSVMTLAGNTPGDWLAYIALAMLAGGFGYELKVWSGESEGESKAWAPAMLVVLLAGMFFTAFYNENASKYNDPFIKEKDGYSLREEFYYPKRIHLWNVFHYTMGSKYFDEVGYFNLYYACLESGKKGIFKDIQALRNMYTYKPIKRKRALENIKDIKIRGKFTKKRWREFTRDLRFLHNFQRGNWTNMLEDLGFNPSPAWLMIHYPLLNSFNMRQGNNLKHIIMFQLLLYLIAIGFSWWAFGLRTTLVGALWMCMYFGNQGRILGGYFSYDYFCAGVIAVALAKKSWLKTSAPILAYSAMMRGYPGMMALPYAVHWLRNLFTLKPKPVDEDKPSGLLSRLSLSWPPRKYTVFSMALVLGCLAIVGLGSTTKRGFNAWLEWKEKIGNHSKYQPLASRRIGLTRVFARDLGTGHHARGKEQSIAILEKNKPIIKAAKFLMIALALLAMVRRSDHDGMLLGLIVAFALFVLSRYYFCLWVLMFTWDKMDRYRIGNLLAGMGLFAITATFQISELYWKSAMHIRFYNVNLAIAIYLSAILLFFLGKDLVWLLRKRRVQGLGPEVTPKA